MGIHDREYYRDETRGGGAARFLPQTWIARLILLNVLLYLANFFFWNETNGLTQQLKLNANTLVSPLRWWEFVTYAFVHNPFDMLHLVCNMLALWCFGREVEDRLGGAELLRFYLLAAILGGVVWAGRHYAMNLPTRSVLGASGAVTAVVILFICQNPRRQILLFLFLPVPAWVAGILLVGLDLVLAGNPLNQVAADVHLTGAAFGFLYYRQQWNLGRGLPDWSAWRKRRAAAKRHLRIHQEAVEDEPEEAYRGLDDEADRILDKLHHEGEASLTEPERRTLEAYSRRMRQKHR